MWLPPSPALKNTISYDVILLICTFHTLTREGGSETFIYLFYSSVIITGGGRWKCTFSVFSVDERWNKTAMELVAQFVHSFMFTDSPPFVCAAPQLWRDWPPLSSPLTFSTHMLSDPSFGTVAQNTVVQSFVALAPARLCATLELEKVSCCLLVYFFLLWAAWPFIVIAVVCFKVSSQSLKKRCFFGPWMQQSLMFSMRNVSRSSATCFVRI